MRKTLVVVMALSVLTAEAQAKDQLVTLATRSGVEQKFLFIESPNPTASVILFAGGKGTVRLSKGRSGINVGWGKNNFLVRTRKEFVEHGFSVAVVDAPSDRQGKQGMLEGFRASPAHVTDIDAVITELRRRADVPVWLVGTSRGTESAAHVAIYSRQRPAGLIMTSSMSVPNSNGVAVTEMPLGEITIPTLIVAHKQDGCPKTPAEGAALINAGLRRAPRVDVAYFEGGREEAGPCDARTHHGFLGLESQVVARIAAFINGR